MTERLTKAQIEQELTLNRQLIQQLRARQDDLIAARNTALPAEPPADMYGDTLAVDVRFSTRGKPYRFLLLRTPNGWYTTGLHKANNYFPTWEALAGWLTGPDVAWHSAMIALTEGPVVLDGSV